LTTRFLLYGSYGYTGSLIADLAVKRGMRPILAGRDAVRLKAQAEALDLEYWPFSVDDRDALEFGLEQVPVVLNCAGPFHRTFQPLVDACLWMNKHYLDITGEIVVFEALAARDSVARQAGSMLLPGVGFDVVPSDCLAAHLKLRLPNASRMALAISLYGGGISRGTILSAIEHIPDQGAIRKDGKLVQMPLLEKTRQIDFGRGLRTAMNIPWGDLSTAYYSTGIPNIEAYMVFPKASLRMMPLLQPFLRLASKPLAQWALRWMVKRLPSGPSVEARILSWSRLWGEAIDNTGRRVVTRLETPDAYNLTAETALAAVSRVLADDFKPGFQTPSLAYGADFILEFEEVYREDLELD
jgi:short subunit dehydrogenase-like uncharacterized protein